MPEALAFSSRPFGYGMLTVSGDTIPCLSPACPHFGLLWRMIRDYPLFFAANAKEVDSKG